MLSPIRYFRKIFPLIFLLPVSLFLFNGCGEEKLELPFTGTELRNLVQSAMEGNEKVNARLGELFDLTLPVQTSLNKFILDSLDTKFTIKFYYLLLEYPNPVYNRFAVYDTLGHLYLLDKSLNGNLSVFTGQLDSVPYFRVVESFRTKDTIILKRLNIYTYRKNTYSLAFRTFTYYLEDKVEREQFIESISLKTITTKFRKEDKSDFIPEGEVFTYDEKQEAYYGKYRYFDSMVVRRIAAFRKKVSSNQIVDKATALKSAGFKTSVDSVHKYNNEKDVKKGFSIFVPEGWRIRRDIYVVAHVKSPMKGNYYTNDSQGASFAVIEMAESDSAENHISYTLDQSVEKYYRVKFTDKIQIKRQYIRFFEISCINKKYLIIFEVPVYSFDKNQDVYEAIINSFGVNC